VPVMHVYRFAQCFGSRCAEALTLWGWGERIATRLRDPLLRGTRPGSAGYERRSI